MAMAVVEAMAEDMVADTAEAMVAVMGEAMAGMAAVGEAMVDAAVIMAETKTLNLTYSKFITYLPNYYP